MQNRQYQEEQVKKVVDAIERNRTVCVQLPTGGGKTVEFSMIIKMYLHKIIEIQHGPVLIMVHREELLNQAASAVKEILGFDPCLITSETSRYWISRVYIGMVESTLSRLHMIVDPCLIIIDECHLQNFTKVHREFSHAKVLGFSATPLSVSKKDPLKNYYEKIITGPSIKELINMGFLAQNLTRAPASSVDADQFSFDRLKGDYNERQMSSIYSMQQNITNVIDQYFNFCKKKKTLVFNVTIEHSKAVNECFVACGYNSRHLDAGSNSRPSKDPRCKNEREEIFLWFKETPDAILNSVMIPTMGFDEPTVQCIMLNFSTMSLVKFIQCCGRGSRVIDQYFIENKQINYPYQLKTKSYFDIIDLGQNWKRFGDWNDERDWYRIFMYPDSPGDGIAPVKTCPECEALVHAATRLCPHCGHEFKSRHKKQMDIEEMILITKGIDVNALTERSEKKYKYYPFFELAIDVVDNMYNIAGNNPSQEIVNRYFSAYYDLCCQWYDKTIGKNEDEIGDISQSSWHIKKAKYNFNSLVIKKSAYVNYGKDIKPNIIQEDVPYQLVDPNYQKDQEISWNTYKSANL